MKFIPVLALCGMVSACATPGVDTSLSDKVAMLPSVPPGATIIGPVEAEHCRRNAYETSSARQSVLELLRTKAAEMGANAVSGISVDVDGVSFMNNCWSSAKAKGTALRR